MVAMKVRRGTPTLSASQHVLNDKDDVTHLLILRFRQMMSDGTLRPGAKLPPERELAAHFKVARSSLRPALKVLEIMGVIQQKVGDGSYLNRDASSVLAVPMEFLFLLDDTSAQELTELRFMMEPTLAAKAAKRANSDDIALLRQSIRDLEASKGDHVKLVAADLLFHRAIFQASGNRLTGRLFHTIHRAMLNMMMVTSQLVELEHTLAFHKPICDAIEQGDAALASRLMKAHLADATRLLRQIQEHDREHLFRDHIVRSTLKVKRNSVAMVDLPSPEQKTREGSSKSKANRQRTLTGASERNGPQRA
jgi:GntR family transcriptional regulator, transcriptional repressor for pyruvate dehydrogenase complex